MATDMMKTLRHKRGLIKARLTRLRSSLENTEIPDSTLEQMLDKVKEGWGAYDDIQTQIELLAPHDNHTADRDQFEKDYYEIVGTTEQHLKRSTNNQSAPTRETIASPSNTSNFSRSGMKLPDIHLATFDGTYDNWIRFRDSFVALIHNNPNISNEQKVHYLRSALRDEAADIIADIDAEEDNYDIAWTLLKEQYDNQRIIIQRHVRAVLDAPNLARDASNIRPWINNIKKHLRALKTLKQPVESWDALLIGIIVPKLDRETHREWEASLELKEIPVWSNMLAFLEKRRQTLEALTNKGPNESTIKSAARPTQHTAQTHVRPRNKPVHTYVQAHPRHQCEYCKGLHNVFACAEFLKLDTKNRNDFVRTKHLCLNCLRPNHAVNDCKSIPCKRCQKRHHTLLHREWAPTETSVAVEPAAGLAAGSNTKTTLSTFMTSQVLLSTAVVEVRNTKGEYDTCRVLLDSGSQSNFITDDLAATLGLTRTEIDIPVAGLSNITTRVKHSVTTTVRSRQERFSANLSFLVVPNIASLLPTQSFGRNTLPIPTNRPLADPLFNQANRIDALLGAEIYYRLLKGGQVHLKPTQAILQQTRLGWVVSGPIGRQHSSTEQRECHLHTADLNNIIERFWRLESTPEEPARSKEEAQCERHYDAHTTRLSDGRYQVNLPFKDETPKLGDSYQHALRRFYALERRLDRNQDLKQQYRDFLQEYEQLGHMREVQDDHEGYYLPHHAVMKDTSLTTKVRVVFDASAKSDNGLSLNDNLMVGPTVQSDLFTLLLRFRKHEYVLSADIEKMYRQILVNEADTRYQRILWREDKTQQIRTYALQTVTYGTASAPYLATRTLARLADDEGANSPMASRALKADFYVDDLLTGAPNYQEACKLRDDLMKLTAQGKFHLRQWASNSRRLIQDLPAESTRRNLMLGETTTTKTLGIHWDSQRDTILYTSQVESTVGRLTKRIILSHIAKIFDPLGLLGPIILQAKLLMRHLWTLKLNWDDALPLEITEKWTRYVTDLRDIDRLTIPRLVIVDSSVASQVHGFCDASERAYGACIYLRSQDNTGRVRCRLLCAKSRVAPLKTITIPRLELCAAQLLGKLFTTVNKALEMPVQEVRLWTDSTIVLNWLRTSPHLLKTFVSNRVTDILETTQAHHWHHVPTDSNPADLISRGLPTADLISNRFWFQGPEWLTDSEEHWPNDPVPLQQVEELKGVIALTNIAGSFNIWERFSSITTLIRVTAYCMRFSKKCKRKTVSTGPLDAAELTDARQRLLRRLQQASFQAEISSLQQNLPLDKGSKLLTLSPFLDENGLLRVGGRLRHAALAPDSKHPILMPKGHHLTKLIIEDIHRSHCHTGAQATLHLVRQRYWPLDARNTIRRVIYNCIRCYRTKPRLAAPVMGNLPRQRITVARPFENCGVDYCGPFYVKERRYRNRNKVKVYVAVFVCFVTKAVHLEVVGDLTSETFIAALRRFMARRGKCRNIYSDNATTFVGADKELQHIHHQRQSEEYNQGIAQFLSSQTIRWHYIPPRAPHFGGLWEGAVKSFKGHFKRTVGNALFTCEQFNTYVIEIEGILNSRPITPVSSDPDDLTALSPSHFLIGDSMTNAPEDRLTDISTNRLSCWQHIQQVKQHFWTRWQKEYLQELITKRNWSKTTSNLKMGTMVLIKEDNTPPLHWPLGRIIQIHPGDDHVVRVVTVRTKGGDFKRSVRRLAPLPLDED